MPVKVQSFHFDGEIVVFVKFLIDFCCLKMFIFARGLPRALSSGQRASGHLPVLKRPGNGQGGQSKNSGRAGNSGHGHARYPSLVSVDF